VEKPALSTGGGDNFNGGFCTGLLLGLGAAEAALMGTLGLQPLRGRWAQPEKNGYLESIAH